MNLTGDSDQSKDLSDFRRWMSRKCMKRKKTRKNVFRNFGYNIGKVRFQTSYHDVEKKIQKEWKKILEAERTEALLPYRNQ